ncbi:hypothetical protein F1880_001264 [Penicillium rolfsii]|nr:hypothetical protein F1880_001264 [Penicillium rolfsii]
MSNYSQMSTFMPFNAEEPPSNAAIPAGSRSGRGIPLKPREKALLVLICEQQYEEGRYADKPKSFWRWISESFMHEAGRTYSWQSCRRRMIKWENENRPLPPRAPSPIMSNQVEPSGVELSENTPNPDEVIGETHHSNDGEDDDLPPVPVSVARNTHVHTQDHREGNADRRQYQRTINDAVVHLEICLSKYSHKIIDDKDDLRNVRVAFERFQDEYMKAVKSGKGGL